MKTRLALLCLIAALALSPAGAQEQPAAETDWRALKPTRDFLAKRGNKDTPGLYKIDVLDVLVELGREGRISIRFDRRSVAALSPLELNVGEQAYSRTLFELAQAGLDKGGLALFAEPGRPRCFSVEDVGRAHDFAPLVEPGDLDTLSAAEWAMVVIPFRMKSGSTLLSAALSVASSRGGRATLSDAARTLTLVDRAASLRRARDILARMDREQAPPPRIVEYSRLARVRFDALVANLRELLRLHGNQFGVEPGTTMLEYDVNSGMVTGRVPTELASLIDATLEAAERGYEERKALEAENQKAFTSFSIVVPAGVKPGRVEIALRRLYEQELARGDLRIITPEAEGSKIVVRCRPWLENDVRQAAAVLTE